MVILICPECGSSHITLNCKFDAKCVHCGHEDSIDCFDYQEIEEED